jgi:hypothetical protein
MGFYSKHLFPHLMDHALSRPQVMQIREEALAEVDGKTLEIGFGTALNLECYLKSVREIVAVEPNSHMRGLADKRINNSRIHVDAHTLSAEKMPFFAVTAYVRYGGESSLRARGLPAAWPGCTRRCKQKPRSPRRLDSPP